ncbi:hypothetical protein IWX63_003125 [Arthrobacter sp. CAN_A2]
MDTNTIKVGPDATDPSRLAQRGPDQHRYDDTEENEKREA